MQFVPYAQYGEFQWRLPLAVHFISTPSLHVGFFWLLSRLFLAIVKGTIEAGFSRSCLHEFRKLPAKTRVSRQLKIDAIPLKGQPHYFNGNSWLRKVSEHYGNR